MIRERLQDRIIKERLEQLYVQDRLGTSDLAHRLGTNRESLRKLIHKYGIPMRGRGSGKAIP